MRTILLALLFFCGCAKQPDLQIQPVGLPFDNQSKNIALLFTMTDENGRIANLEMMESIFEDGRLGFECRRHHNLPSPDIYKTITETTKEIDDSGTLLLYLNSHGGGSGDAFGMTARGGSFKVSKAIQAVADGKKVKRLIILIDTCYAAGGIREGFHEEELLIPNAKTGLIELPIEFYGSGDAYEEALIIASSSTKNQSVRGAFASRLRDTYKEIKDEQRITLTVAEFLRIFAGMHSNTSQKPYYKALPSDAMLDEPLFWNAVARLSRYFPIIDHQIPRRTYPQYYVPVP